MRCSLLFYILFLIAVVMPVMNQIFADALPELSFDQVEWRNSEGVRLVDDVLSIDGHADHYRRAVVSVPAKAFVHQTFFYIVQIKLDDIAFGTARYMRPKLKIYQDGKKHYQARNIQGIIPGSWRTVSLEYRVKPDQHPATLDFELGVESCQGKVLFRRPQVVFNKPQLPFIYPFEKPEKPVCRLSIDTNKSMPMNHQLLGVNQQFVWCPVGYEDAVIGDFLAKLRPPHLRFPAGTVANFYDWKTDGFAIPEPYHGRHNRWLVQRIADQYRLGFEGYSRLCRQLDISSQLTFNVMTDSVASSVARLQNRLDAGLKIAHVEMGNENCYPDQNGGLIPDVQSYIAHTRQLSAALKQISPDISTAVNISGNLNEWDRAIAQADYYDAVVMHPYLQVHSSIVDDETVSLMLGAYAHFNDEIARYQSLFGSKPLLLSEWGIDGKPAGSDTVLAGLALADMFMAILEHAEKGLVKEGCLHLLISSHKDASLLFRYDPKSKQVIQSRRGVIYRMMLDTFRDSQVFAAQSDSPLLRPGLPSVLARAVRKKDGKLLVFAVNKLDVACPLELRIDGEQFAGGYTLHSYTETDTVGEAWYPLVTKATESLSGLGPIVVPPFSVNVIVLNQ